jgi:hypothetical protein
MTWLRAVDMAVSRDGRSFATGYFFVFVVFCLLTANMCSLCYDYWKYPPCSYCWFWNKLESMLFQFPPVTCRSYQVWWKWSAGSKIEDTSHIVFLFMWLFSCFNIVIYVFLLLCLIVRLCTSCIFIYMYSLYVYVSSLCQLALFGYPDWGLSLLFPQL